VALRSTLINLLNCWHNLHCAATGREKKWKFREILCCGLWGRLRPWKTREYTTRLDRSRTTDVVGVHSLGDCTSGKSRLSTRASSVRDWLRSRQPKIAHFGRSFKVDLGVYLTAISMKNVTLTLKTVYKAITVTYVYSDEFVLRLSSSFVTVSWRKYDTFLHFK